MLIHDVVLMLPYYESKSAAIFSVQHLLNMGAEQMHNSLTGGRSEVIIHLSYK